MEKFITQKQVWGRTLASLCLMLLLAACSGGHNTPPSTPVIATQPADASVVAGNAASFSVTATGNSPSYQWQASGDRAASWTDIPGATSTSYTLATTVLGDSGRLFRVLVTAAGATVASSPAQLTVTSTVQAPAITVQPANQTVTEPAIATFSVTASGTSLQYQWQFTTDSEAPWMDIGGATSSSYTTPGTAVAASGTKFRVQVSNSAGSVTSNAATLTINPASSANAAPSFTTQPASQSVAVGTTATFSASISGTPTPTLQWQRSNNSGASWADLAGATSNNYTTPATVAGDDGAQFRLIATNSEGNATSGVVTLTVTAANVAPVFITQPQSASVSAGTEVIFTVEASGTPAPAYQWQVSTDNSVSWNNMSSETGSSYAAAPANRYSSDSYFRAVASNSAGTAISDVVRVELECPIALTFSNPGGGGHQLMYLNDTHSEYCPSQSSSSVNPDTGIHIIDFKDVSGVSNGWTLRVQYRSASQGSPQLLQVDYVHPYLDPSTFGFVPFSCPDGNTACTDMSVDLDNHLITFNGTALKGPVTGDGDQGVVSWRGSLSFP